VIIAIDGPAGSGKSSTAQAVARALGFRHLDSGAYYRALTLAAIRSGIPPAAWHELDADQLDAFAISAVPDGTGFRMRIGGADVGEEIRDAEVTARVSTMARVPAVRSWLLQALRAVAESTDLVADGRDIGTVVFPDAELKVFLVADPRERARRRLLQMKLPAGSSEIAAEVQRIEERDRSDSTRESAPLRQADDARVLDSTGLSFDEQVQRVVQWAREAGAREDAR
jgi:CMP/dCMP kinase